MRPSKKRSHTPFKAAILIGLLIASTPVFSQLKKSEIRERLNNLIALINQTCINDYSNTNDAYKVKSISSSMEQFEIHFVFQKNKSTSSYTFKMMLNNYSDTHMLRVKEFESIAPNIPFSEFPESLIHFCKPHLYRITFACLDEDGCKDFHKIIQKTKYEEGKSTDVVYDSVFYVSLFPRDASLFRQYLNLYLASITP